MSQSTREPRSWIAGLKSVFQIRLKAGHMNFLLALKPSIKSSVVFPKITLTPIPISSKTQKLLRISTSLERRFLKGYPNQVIRCEKLLVSQSCHPKTQWEHRLGITRTLSSTETNKTLGRTRIYWAKMPNLHSRSQKHNTKPKKWVLRQLLT